MSLNPKFNLLKQIFWVKKEDRNLKEQGMAESKEKGKKEITKRENSIDIPKTFRSEFHFLKFPFFNLCTRQSKMEQIEILEEEETKEGKIEIWWRVTRNIKTNFPSSFARKLHKEVVEKTLNKLKKPVQRLIKLGSFNQICKDMNIAISGKNKKDIKKALKDIRGAKIEAKGTFRLKEKNGGKKFIEGDFNLYDGVYFTGEKLPDGNEADAVYVLLSDYYIQNFNNNFVVPIDYQYFQSLEGDIASRMYEILSVWFYPALENGKDSIEKQYSELCNYFPLIKQNTKWKAKGQLKRAHRQHVLSGFLASEPEWRDTQKKDDWVLRYLIGEKAREWHRQNKNKRAGALEEVKQIEEKLEKKIEIANEPAKQEKQNRSEITPLVIQLTNLGITKKVAEDLVGHKDLEIIKEWIEAVHGTNAKDKAAFVVRAIEEGWELPEVFRKKKKTQVEEKQKEREKEIKSQYSEFVEKKFNEYKAKVGQEKIEQEIQAHKKIFLNKYPFYQQFKDGEALIPFVKGDYKFIKAKELGILSFEEWVKQNKTEGEQLFEVKKIEENMEKRTESGSEKEPKRQGRAELNPLITQLTDLGITKKVAEDLITHKDPELIIGWAKVVYHTKAKDKAAFVVRAIEEGWELPEGFRKRREEEEKRQVLLKQQEERAKYFKQYEEYKKEKIDYCFKQITQEQKQEELEQIKKELYKKCPYVKTWEGKVIKETLEATFEERVKERANYLFFQRWLEEQKITI